MLKYRLLHPHILEALASAGHGSRVLIADGNYPLATLTNPQSHRVYLNLAPGVVTVTQVLEVLVEAIPVEAIQLMQPEDGSAPPVFNEVQRLVGSAPMQRLGRHQFYEAAMQPSLVLAIATGEQRLYANVLLTIGVVK